MILDDLITDRTWDDVELVRLLSEAGDANMTGTNRNLYRAGNLKGAYNFRDLNRVEEAVEYVADELVQADTDLHDYATAIGVTWDSYYELPYDTAIYAAITVKKDWVYADIPSYTQMTRYINNLYLIRAALTVPSPLPASMDNLNYTGANQIEQMLLDVHEALQIEIDIKKSYIDSTANAYRCGEVYSGEVDA
jgi:hypothetical protein